MEKLLLTLKWEVPVITWAAACYSNSPPAAGSIIKVRQTLFHGHMALYDHSLQVDSLENDGTSLDLCRSGPGIKSLAKKKSVAKSLGGRSTPDQAAVDCTPEKLLKKKHVYKSKKKQAAPVRQRNPSNASLAVSDFLDMTLWEK